MFFFFFKVHDVRQGRRGDVLGGWNDALSLVTMGCAEKDFFFFFF